MSRIMTYVFLDLETTGLPREENNKTKITELSFIAVKRFHLLETRRGASPRVQHKLTLCLNPGRLIQPDGTKITGLCNDLLEHEPTFNLDIFNILNTFLNVLTKPLCLIAQNGLGYDFPILKNHLVKLGVSFSDDIVCADSYHAFFDILESQKKAKVETVAEKMDQELTPIDLTDFFLERFSQQSENETTPKRNKIITNNQEAPKKNPPETSPSKACRRFPWSDGEKPTESYKLKNIYERLLNRPGIEAHRAENDCLMTLECSAAVSVEFVEWVDKNYLLFSEIKPMTIGVPLGK